MSSHAHTVENTVKQCKTGHSGHPWDTVIPEIMDDSGQNRAVTLPNNLMDWPTCTQDHGYWSYSPLYRQLVHVGT